ncbi:hypothetical protein KSP40_PGU013947 [Platanthera guangdongensis]|uniref:Uncharacterized protein n=1 Tax=Platanthera guangdongensis TaxID=2320717 RepID=A0ABR2MD35_9ASPA
MELSKRMAAVVILLIFFLGLVTVEPASSGSSYFKMGRQVRGPRNKIGVFGKHKTPERDISNAREDGCFDIYARLKYLCQSWNCRNYCNINRLKQDKDTKTSWTSSSNCQEDGRCHCEICPVKSPPPPPGEGNFFFNPYDENPSTSYGKEHVHVEL